MSAPALFLDRDGTLMEEVHYCADPALVRVYAGAGEALRRARAAGFRTIVITNQSGIGRGLMTEAQYRAVEAEFLRQLGQGSVDAGYFCPDAPGAPSKRRKPAPGMVLEAAAEHDLDLARSFFIGDKSADIECGRRAGTRSILVLTGYGRRQQCEPDFTAAGIVEAVDLALDLSGPQRDAAG
jgi:D-glycero-D-manno-heptose 1,7-bisphosphate phosphatase